VELLLNIMSLAADRPPDQRLGLEGFAHFDPYAPNHEHTAYLESLVSGSPSRYCILSSSMKGYEEQPCTGIPSVECHSNATSIRAHRNQGREAYVLFSELL
jgi:hypothetical protein